MKVTLSVVLGFSVLVDLALAAWAGVAWGPAEHGIPSFLRFWLPSLVSLPGASAADARLLGLVLALCLLGFAALQALALRWVWTENEAGPRVAIVFGVWLVVSSLAVFLAFQRWEFLLVDGLRGAALAVFGVVALHAPATVRELRLPEKSRERRPESGRLRDRDTRERRRVGSGDRGARRPGSDRGLRTDRSRDRRPGREQAPAGRRDLSSARAEEPERAERRDLPEESDRSLKVVIRGAPEGLRAPASASGGRAPDLASDHDAEREAPEARSRRRRRRRSPGEPRRALTTGADRPPDAGREPSEPRDGEGLFVDSQAVGTEDRAGGDREGRPRRRRRRRRPAGGEERTEPSVAGAPALGSDVPARAPSPVEALDMLSLLEPASRRPSANEPFGRGRRIGPRRPFRPSESVPSKPDPGLGSGETRDNVPPPSVRPDYGREEGSDSEREPD